MIKKKYGLLLCLFVALFSCKAKKDGFAEYNQAVSEFYTDSLLSNLKAIIIIPGEGCGACISEAAFFCITHKYEMGSYGVIFTGTKDKKILKVQFGEDFLSEKRVKIDVKGLFMKGKIRSVYPQFLILDNSKVVRVKEFSPKKKESIDSIYAKIK